jgi:molybdate transport system ATP-binding protein
LAQELKHYAVYITDSQASQQIIDGLCKGLLLSQLEQIGKSVRVISPSEIGLFLEHEHRFGQNLLLPNSGQSLLSHSSGEQKKLYLNYVLAQPCQTLIVDRLYDYLDTTAVLYYQQQLQNLASTVQIVQLIYKDTDRLPFIQNTIILPAQAAAQQGANHHFAAIPEPFKSTELTHNELVSLQNVHINYGNKVVLHNINWQVEKGQFWLLKGPNGSGKSTLLSLILGENPKAFKQNIRLFGQLKGSGESVWDLKKNIGYFNPALVQLFERHTSALHMMVSGIYDSVGLYKIPTERQLRIAGEWLQLIGLQSFTNTAFHKLTAGQQRLLMVARAMIKQPPLLLLDEPTTSLDQANVHTICQLINHFASNSRSTVVFVSHQLEAGLQPRQYYELKPCDTGGYTGVNL